VGVLGRDQPSHDLSDILGEASEGRKKTKRRSAGFWTKDEQKENTLPLLNHEGAPLTGKRIAGTKKGRGSPV